VLASRFEIADADLASRAVGQIRRGEEADLRPPAAAEPGSHGITTSLTRIAVVRLATYQGR
jgi:hypothetical protein